MNGVIPAQAPVAHPHRRATAPDWQLGRPARDPGAYGTAVWGPRALTLAAIRDCARQGGMGRSPD
jgi:hypothetical protein